MCVCAYVCAFESVYSLFPASAILRGQKDDPLNVDRTRVVSGESTAACCALVCMCVYAYVSVRACVRVCTHA